MGDPECFPSDASKSRINSDVLPVRDKTEIEMGIHTSNTNVYICQLDQFVECRMKVQNLKFYFSTQIKGDVFLKEVMGMSLIFM